MAILWALPTPRTILTVGLAWESPHPVSNWESRKLLFKFRNRSSDAKVLVGQSVQDFLSFLSDLIWTPQLCTLLDLECLICFEVDFNVIVFVNTYLFGVHS